MLVDFNKPGLIIGSGSFLASLVIAKVLGWMDDQSQDSYFFVMAGGFLAVIDLAYRLRCIKDINVPPPPTIITREGPVPTQPQPLTNLLNMFLSGEKGAQYFWVVPGWILGLVVVYFGFAEVTKAR